MLGLIKKLFGTHQSRLVKKYSKTVSRVNEKEKEYQNLSDEQIKAKTEEFKKRFENGESLDDILVEAYAAVKNMCRRLMGTDIHVSGYDQKWDMIPYDVQIIGAISMHYGSIAEMQTGEGKTLTAALPLYLNALSGKPVHLVTVNDYLAKRDCEWIGVLFRSLGLSVSYLANDIHPSQRRDTYQADIVYGTASEFGFDYLRDNSMAMQKLEQSQRGHFFAIIDEVDSILIDEARTPLIISGPVADSKQMYDELKDQVSFLVKKQKELCSKLATDAKRVLDSFNILSDTESKKLNKEEKEKKEDAFKTLWLVSKGVPRQKIIKKIKENPDLRAEFEKLETYFHSDQTKQEKQEILSRLYIIVDERTSEHELTDKGIDAWSSKNTSEEDDFVMLDLGYEYAKVDENTELTQTQKMEKKNALCEQDTLRKERSHNLRQLFRAHLLMEKDVDYIIQEGKIVIIDENTGRPQPGRRFSDGLHQAIEAKESVKVQGETQTYATITLQNYFRLYTKLAGMTGTAITEASEFKEVYKLEVLEIPTNVKCQRNDFDDEIYMTEREKYRALLTEIQKEHEKGRPILIGTESVEASEKLSRILKQNKLPHSILNAKNHAKEAEIIAEAGHPKRITLATNMAGRGTDIKLKENAAELGGLHVIATTRHQSRRIDRQLRGRCARQGDPGSSKFFVSFEDALMRLFASPKMTAILQRFRPPEGEPISAKVLNKSIETAQKRVEQRNYTMRKHTLEYDDVMNKQREEIYTFRNELLRSDNPIEIAKEILISVTQEMTEQFFLSRAEKNRWDIDGYHEWLLSTFPISFDRREFSKEDLKLEDVEKIVTDKVILFFEQKIAFQNEIITKRNPEATSFIQEIVRNLMLRIIDELWQKHLLSIDHLRSDVQMRSFAQKDPLIEFKHDAFSFFDRLSKDIKLDISKDLFRFEMVPPDLQPLAKIEKNLKLEKEPSLDLLQEESKVIPIQATESKVKRNELCPCGSGKKHKKCCAKISST